MWRRAVDISLGLWQLASLPHPLGSLKIVSCNFNKGTSGSFREFSGWVDAARGVGLFQEVEHVSLAIELSRAVSYHGIGFRAAVSAPRALEHEVVDWFCSDRVSWVLVGLWGSSLAISQYAPDDANFAEFEVAVPSWVSANNIL